MIAAERQRETRAYLAGGAGSYPIGIASGEGLTAANRGGIPRRVRANRGVAQPGAHSSPARLDRALAGADGASANKYPSSNREASGILSSAEIAPREWTSSPCLSNVGSAREPSRRADRTPAGPSAATPALKTAGEPTLAPVGARPWSWRGEEVGVGERSGSGVAITGICVDL